MCEVIHTEFESMGTLSKQQFLLHTDQMFVFKDISIAEYMYISTYLMRYYMHFHSSNFDINEDKHL